MCLYYNRKYVRTWRGCHPHIRILHDAHRQERMRPSLRARARVLHSLYNLTKLYTLIFSNKHTKFYSFTTLHPPPPPPPPRLLHTIYFTVDSLALLYCTVPYSVLSFYSILKHQCTRRMPPKRRCNFVHNEHGKLAGRQKTHPPSTETNVSVGPSI